MERCRHYFRKTCHHSYRLLDFLVLERFRRGFTLIELLVVIAILAVISTIGMVTYNGLTKGAKDARRKNDVNEIAKALEANFSNGVYQDIVGTDFAAGGIPQKPEGENYDLVFSEGNTAFRVCVALEENPSPSCTEPAPDCFCKFSSQGAFIAAASPSPPPSLSPSPASVTVDNATNAHAWTYTLTWPHTVGSDSSNYLLVVGFSWYDATISVTSVKYNSVGLTRFGTGSCSGSGGSDMCSEIYYMVAPPTGLPYNVEIKMAGNKPNIVAGATSLSNVNQTTPFGASAKNFGTSLNPSVIVSSAIGDMVIDNVAVFPAIANLTANDSQTQRYQTVDGNTRGAGSTALGAGSVTMSWTGAGGAGKWATIAAPIKPFVGAGPSPSASPVSGPVDLNVTYISRTPRYDRYYVCYNPIRLCGGQSEGDKRWPSAGDAVTFTAKAANKGSSASGTFAYKWFIDGVEVSQGTDAGIPAGSMKTFNYNWIWQNGDHKVKFVADSGAAISETYETNNQIEDYTNALSLRIHVELSVYSEFNNLVNLKGTKSYEDWVQGQLGSMKNYLTVAGSNEKVRIDEIVVEGDGILPRGGTHAPVNWAWDGSWGFETTEWPPANIQNWVTKTQNALIHEWGHQLGLVDSYQLNYDYNNIKTNYVIPQCVSFPGGDARGGIYEICMYYNTDLNGMMANPDSAKYVSFETGALASNLGKRRGFFGEYLFDIPASNRIRFLDKFGGALSSTSVSFYQSSGCGAGRSLPDAAIFSGTTDGSGYYTLPNRAVTSVTTATGHTLQNNPFGTIDVVGCNGILLIKITNASGTDYQWTDISKFNNAYWAGNTASAEYTVTTKLSP